MGALHEGHMSLINTSAESNHITVCSIFVNPAQFNNPKDLEKYPRTLEADIELLAGRCDILFVPSHEEIYPPFYLKKSYDLGHLEKIFEGEYRPGHFQGVCQVVEILLRIVEPNELFVGQKDYQQCLVIERLIELIGFKNKVQLRICPTMREPDGLAMSSRNLRLTKEERLSSVALSKALKMVKENYKKGSFTKLLEDAENILRKNNLKPDYISIADANDLRVVEKWDGKNKLVALAAAFAGDVRLIDNMLLN
jgi:pantoate--beta-alanine ligase